MGWIGSAGSSKTAPRILIFSIAMGADYSFYVKSIVICAPTFFGYIISVLASVILNPRTSHFFSLHNVQWKFQPFTLINSLRVPNNWRKCNFLFIT